MKKNRTGENQCCWKTHTSVSWSACQPSAHEVPGLIRLMHLLMGLTRLFNESVIFSTRSSFNILRQGPHCTEPRVFKSAFLSPFLGPKQRWPETLERGFQKIAFPSYGNSSPIINHSLAEIFLKITLWRTVLCPKQHICACSSLLLDISESSGWRMVRQTDMNDIVLPTGH